MRTVDVATRDWLETRLQPILPRSTPEHLQVWLAQQASCRRQPNTREATLKVEPDHTERKADQAAEQTKPESRVANAHEMREPLPSACGKSPPRSGLPEGYPFGYPRHTRNLVKENVKKVQERAQPHRRRFNNQTHRLQRDIEQLPNPSSFTTRIMQHIGQHPVISSNPPFYRTENAAGRERFGLVRLATSYH
eukprot:gene15347-18155_t